MLLAIDTSTSAITVGVHDGHRLLAERSVIDPRRHTEELAPAIAAVLAEAGISPGDVTGVAVGTGPGPFTGLRVGLVTARTFAWARGIPVHGVCSLDALAHAWARTGSGEFVVATDARRKEVYWARYRVADGQPGHVERLTEPAVVRPADLPHDVRGLPAVGRGAVLYPEVLSQPAGPLDVRAGDLAEVALARLAAGEAMPVDALYLRRPDAAPVGSAKPTVPAGWGERRGQAR